MKLVMILGSMSICAISVGNVPTVPAETSIPNSDRSIRLSPSRKVTRSRSAMNPLELDIYNQVNQYRQAQNLPALAIDATISAQARAHSVAMAKTSHLSHDGFDNRAQAVNETIPYRSVAENVAYNMGHASPAVIAVKGWIKSPGHQKNMVGEYDLTGIGVTQNAKGEYYFTQIFLHKR